MVGTRILGTEDLEIPQTWMTVAPHNPVYLTAKSLHSAWVNTAALRISGISSNTPDPVDGAIQRDERGNPTGILLEGAVKLITDFIPSPTINRSR